MVVHVPAEAFARAESLDDLVFIEPERGRDLEGGAMKIGLWSSARTIACAGGRALVCFFGS